MNNNIRTAYLLIFLLTLMVNLLTINTAFFTDDPGLYASITKQLVYKGEFFQLYSYGRDWLDKPHLPFWVVLMSFKIFGIHTWSYKLPALLCFILSLLYTWLFAKKYYSGQVAAMAMLIVSTSLHITMSNADVRAEPYLMAFIIGAIYHISNLDKRFNIIQFVLAALLIALAIMTKGIFVIVPVYGALGGQLLLQKRYRDIFQWKWVGLVLLTIIYTAPELYGLYLQFDLHPEKVVFNKQHVSGIKWFLWDSQFGRFANDGPITRKQGDVFFFFHTLLWAFAPWCLLFYFAAAKSIKKIITGFKLPEYYTISGGLILLLLFSISGFQLPFYTNIIFPLFAIVTANFCHERLISKGEQVFRSVAQWLYIVLFPLTILLLHYFLKPAGNWFLIVDIAGLIVAIYLLFKKIPASNTRVFLTSCLVMAFTGLYVNYNLYPVIVSHKAQINAAEYVNTNISKETTIYSLKDQNNIFQFYCDRPVKLVPYQHIDTAKTEPGAVFYADQESLDQLTQKHIPVTIIHTWMNYGAENILPAFINSNTRNTTLEKVYLIKRK